MYRHKHKYMTYIKNRINHDFFLPIDIDEFIVFYNKKENLIECDNIMSYFLTLKNIDGSPYECPMIGYYIVHHCRNNIDEMDIYRETIIPELGKSYYLYVDNPNNPDNKNIMRIAFFQGKMIVYNGKKIYNNYDSLMCEIDTTKRYLITDYNQHIVLSYYLFTNKIL